MDFTPYVAIGGFVFLIVVVIAAVLATVAKYYKKVSPNTVAVITGRRHKTQTGSERGFRFVVGGGFFLVPVLEKMELLSLNVIPVKIAVRNVPDKNGALVTVDAIANVKIVSDEAILPLAIERFLGQPSEKIIEVTQQTLEGNLRGIVGAMDVEELLRDRPTFTQNVLSEAGTDLGKMGLGVDALKIQDIRDERGYIESLGKKRTAEVVRDATIGEAEAHRDADVKSAAARQAGETAKAEADKAVSDANRDRDVAIAENEAQVEAQRAQIPIAARIAEAEKNKELNVATVAAEQAQVQAQIGLEEVRAKRNEAEQHATIVVPAEKAKEARIIAADAEQQAAVREGEASRVRAEKEGQGTQAKMTAEAEGRKAAASADQAELVAKAEGNKAELLAAAAGKQADLEAEAAGKLKMAEALKAELLAEAEGLAAKADAYRQLDDAGRFLMILQALPPVIEAAGYALERGTRPMAEAIGEGLGNIDEVRIVDLGGGNGSDGKSVLGRFANQPAQTAFALWEQIKAAGFGPALLAIASRAGIDVEKALLGASTTVDSTATTVGDGTQSADTVTDEAAPAAEPAAPAQEPDKKDT